MTAMYLLDTHVVSELRKAKAKKAAHKANSSVVAWANSVPSNHLFISAITVLELETGILLVERRDPIQGATLRSWLNTHVLPAFADKVLPVDTAVAQRCAELHVPDPRSDRDAMIAATALVHQLTVVTRNVDDFLPTKVSLLNPWESPPKPLPPSTKHAPDLTRTD